MLPLVSIIMPTYNRKEIISKSIESVVNQTYSNWELLIVDDYGSDNIISFINDSYKNDNRIKCICNSRKKGVSGARNTGILEAKGDYVAFLDSDDEWTANHIDELLNAMLKEKIDMGFALWYEKNNNQLTPISNLYDYKKLLKRALKKLPVKICENYYVWSEYFYEFTIITYFYCYHLNTMIVKKELLYHARLFDESLSTNEDCDLLFHLLSQNKFILYNNYHYIYNVSADGLFSFQKFNDKKFDDILKDEEYVRKITQLGIDKIKVRLNSFELIKSSNHVKFPKRCKQVIYQAICKKYITLAIFNQMINRQLSITFLLHALKYDFDIYIFKLMIHMLFNKHRPYTKYYKIDLW